MTLPLGRPGTARIAAAALAGLALAPATASAADVTASKLDWSMASVFDTTQPANTHRTWLGYITDTAFPPPRSSNGSATVSDGTTLSGPVGWTPPGTPKTVVDGTSPRGVNTIYTFSFPGDTAGLGTYEPSTGTGTLEFGGKLAFTTHSLTVFLEKPQVVLDGTKGTLAASGDGSLNLRDITPFGRATPIFDLNLADATVTEHVDGSQTIANIVPTVASTQLFGSSYAAGIAGPNRSPNTFGSFSVRVAVPPIAAVEAAGPVGPAGPAGPAGPVGPVGPKGDNGVAGASGTVRTRSYVLAKAPFSGKKAVNVTVLGRKGSAVTVGSVKGRTLKVKTTLKKGTYKLQRTNRFVKQRTASIKVR